MRVGLQWKKFFKEIAAQNSFVFLDCVRLPTGVKWCKSEWVNCSEEVK